MRTTAWVSTAALLSSSPDTAIEEGVRLQAQEGRVQGLTLENIPLAGRSRSGRFLAGKLCGL
jgi:hypothetical protein